MSLNWFLCVGIVLEPIPEHSTLVWERCACLGLCDRRTPLKVKISVFLASALEEAWPGVWRSWDCWFGVIPQRPCLYVKWGLPHSSRKWGVMILHFSAGVWCAVKTICNEWEVLHYRKIWYCVMVMLWLCVCRYVFALWADYYILPELVD